MTTYREYPPQWFPETKSIKFWNFSEFCFPEHAGWFPNENMAHSAEFQIELFSFKTSFGQDPWKNRNIMIKTTSWALKTEFHVTWRILLYFCKRNMGLLLLYMNRLTVTKLKNIIYVTGNEKQIRFHSNKSVSIRALHKSTKISSSFFCSRPM